jgi:hypothetical protein
MHLTCFHWVSIVLPPKASSFCFPTRVVRELVKISLCSPSKSPPWPSDQIHTTKSAIYYVKCFFIMSGRRSGSGTRPFINLTVSKTEYPKSLTSFPFDLSPITLRPRRSNMMALKRSLIFSSGATGGYDKPPSDKPPSGNKGGESVVETSKGVGSSFTKCSFK